MWSPSNPKTENAPMVIVIWMVLKYIAIKISTTSKCQKCEIKVIKLNLLLHDSNDIYFILNYML